ncbi:dolichol kinase [Marasmius tenuissimus]|uniref:dolichol kinase n=1 Tax=Marasmius tenuissimus TaxID=585030 RepID=A0ABR3A2H9_9AGAR
MAGVVSTTTSATLGLTFPNLPSGATVATDWLDAADKHVPTLRLNARRKFFHGLAVVMFVPGVAFDPAFTHLCFSAAFALFTFAEYVRFFAIYPFGASVHLFMNEFLDQKDGGTAILSHFYLLTGCAGSLWLENGSPLVEFTGILVLGVGDSLASVVGKRIGIHRWSPTSAKSLEGSLAFTLSIVLSAWILYLFGMVESFSTLRYVGVIGCSSLLEALSDQNDNLTLPLFTWSLAVLVGIQ